MIKKMFIDFGRRMDADSKNINKEIFLNVRKYQREVIVELKNMLEGFDAERMK